MYGELVWNKAVLIDIPWYHLCLFRAIKIGILSFLPNLAKPKINADYDYGNKDNAKWNEKIFQFHT